MRFQFRCKAGRPTFELRSWRLNERRRDDIRVARCGAGVVTQPLVSRYCTTVPIRSKTNSGFRAIGAALQGKENHAHPTEDVL